MWKNPCPSFGKEMQVSFLKNPFLSKQWEGQGKARILPYKFLPSHNKQWEEQGKARIPTYKASTCLHLPLPIPNSGKSKKRQGSLLMYPYSFLSQTVRRVRILTDEALPCPFPSQTVGRARKRQRSSPCYINSKPNQRIEMFSIKPTDPETLSGYGREA